MFSYQLKLSGYTSLFWIAAIQLTINFPSLAELTILLYYAKYRYIVGFSLFSAPLMVSTVNYLVLTARSSR